MWIAGEVRDIISRNRRAKRYLERKILKMKKELQKEWELFKTYVFERRWYILVSSTVLLLVYGSWVFHIEPRIDTEIAINHPKSYFNWLGIGRQGLVFTEYIFGLRWFNPYAATVFGYILICASGILFGYIFWRCNHAVPPIVSACFSLFYFSSPIFVEQFYYELQIFQMAWAFIICVVGVGLSYYGILRKDVVAKILSVLCMIWAFSSYQTFMILHVTAVALCYILLYRRWNEDTVCASDSKKYWLILGWQILLFLCAVVANTAITNVFSLTVNI